MKANVKKTNVKKQVDANLQDTINQPEASVMREWILIQAQLQLDYASVDKAISLLELVEAVYGESLTTGLMLCKAWMKQNAREKLETRTKKLLQLPSLSAEQSAAIHYCISSTRWRTKDRVGARNAHKQYMSFISQKGNSA